MHPQYQRTQLLLGEEGMEKLRAARVAVFGLGGVGGHAVEALARNGIGQLDLFDHDTVCLSNLNRQLFATRKTLGRYKVDAAAERIAEIDPDTVVRTYRVFVTSENIEQFDFSVYDYIVDAIDTVSAKIALVVRAKAAGVPVISCMGAGNKMDPTALTVADIYKTDTCPLARVMRRELKKRGIGSLKVVYSKEPAIRPDGAAEEPEDGAAKPRRAPGSNAFVPAAAGLILAGEVVKDLSGYGV